MMIRKFIKSIIFICSLIPMLFPQYGAKGVQEVLGIINIMNVIGKTSVVLFFIGVWIKFKNKYFNKFFAYLGMIGIIVSEIYNLFNWNYQKVNLEQAIKCVLPKFWVGLILSNLMIIIYFIIDKKQIEMKKITK